MRPYLPFMAVLVLFGAVACGGSSSPSSSSSASTSHKPTAAQQAAVLNKATCQKVASYPAYATKSQALAYVSFLEGEASQAGVDNTLASDMMTLSTVLSGHEAGAATLTTAKVTTATATLTAACKKWVS
jgi:hypothetical protein